MAQAIHTYKVEPPLKHSPAGASQEILIGEADISLVQSDPLKCGIPTPLPMTGQPYDILVDDPTAGFLRIPAPMSMTTREPDKAEQDLVSLCAQHIANKSALEACPLEADESPHWPPYSATSAAISAARPTSLAGLAAKARAAKREALAQNGREDPLNGSALEWAWHLVDDLIRLDSSLA